MFFDARCVDAKQLQRWILYGVGLPVTISVSKTRSLTKLASDTVKPFGCYSATINEQIAGLLADRPVEEITGIAGRSRRKLELSGVKTCADFAKADRQLIRRLLTKTGESLWSELNGTPVTAINVTRLPHKIISRGGSVGKATDDPARCLAWIIRNLERLVEALDFHLVVCEQVTLALTFKDACAAGRRANFSSATADYGLIASAMLQMWKQLRQWKASVKMRTFDFG